MRKRFRAPEYAVKVQRFPNTQPWASDDISVELWVPGIIEGHNELIAAAKGKSKTGRPYSEIKRHWTQTVAHLAARAHLPRFKYVQFTFTWVEPNVSRDKDNICAGGRKPIMDGLVAAGVIADDGWDQVDGWVDQWEVGTNPGVLVQIRTAFRF